MYFHFIIKEITYSVDENMKPSNRALKKMNRLKDIGMLWTSVDVIDVSHDVAFGCEILWIMLRKQAQYDGCVS